MKSHVTLWQCYMRGGVGGVIDLHGVPFDYHIAGNIWGTQFS